MNLFEELRGVLFEAPTGAISADEPPAVTPADNQATIPAAPGMDPEGLTNSILRKIMDACPHLAEFFTVRKSLAAFILDEKGRSQAALAALASHQIDSASILREKARAQECLKFTAESFQREIDTRRAEIVTPLEAKLKEAKRCYQDAKARMDQLAITQEALATDIDRENRALSESIQRFQYALKGAESCIASILDTL